ncbi:cytochrome P450 [Streptomyces sp. UNOB3_S3]|uniref:cytochrome P450 n=1 Tax=Streptomyces sp. UNOB3_S3 TaxID=2871682 RepID=UPI001E5BDF62|nr:cytochrome P450 [Streptomyces sp. UNOB3_S3]MCC3774370.1 cytochrome P450 [Streptomyces sp. UNOB3_S3]
MTADRPPDPAPMDTARPLPAVPGGLPLIGHTLPFLRGPGEFLLRHHAALGEAITFTILGTKVASFCSPHLNAAVLGHDDSELNRQYMQARLIPVFGEGHLFDDPPELIAWHKKVTRSVLRREAMARHVTTMYEQVERYTADWGRRGEVDIVTAAREVTALVTAHCLIGPRYGRAMGSALPDLLGRLESALYLSFAVAPGAPMPAYRRRDRARATLTRTIKDIAPEDRPRGLDHGLFETIVGTPRPDGTTTDADAAAAIAMGLLFGGYATTSVHTAWTGILLLQHPRWLPVVRAEQDALFAEPTTPTLQTLHEMDWLGYCLLEAERLHPPAHSILRTAARDVNIGGHLVPRGRMVIVSPAASHRLPQVFRDPHRYDLDRYARHAEHRATPAPLIGFSGGRHPCLGMTFAQQSVKVFWSALLRDFDLELVDTDVRPARLSLFNPPRQPCLLRYHRRKP